MDENVKQLFTEFRRTNSDRREFFRLLELVSVDAQDSAGICLLGKAAEYNDADMVCLLLQKGANVEGGKKKKNTPFVIATEQGHVEIMQILIDAGAMLQPPGIEEHILYSAVRSGEPAAVELLLTVGLAASTHLPREGALCWAATRVRPPTDMLEFLLARGVGDVMAVDDTGHGPLHCLAHYQSSGEDVTDALALLLDHGAAIDQLCNDGKSALIYAAGLGNQLTVDCLLARGADATIADGNGQTALHDTGTHPSAVIVAALLAHGARVDAVDKEGRTLLHCVVRYRSRLYSGRVPDIVPAIRVLLQAGADVNATDKNGDGVLHLWAAHDYYSHEIAQLLIDHGADVAAPNNANQRPSDVAKTDHRRTFLLAAEDAQRNNHRYKRPRLEDLQPPAAIADGADAAAEEEVDESEDESEDEDEEDD